MGSRSFVSILGLLKFFRSRVYADWRRAPKRTAAKSEERQSGNAIGNEVTIGNMLADI